MVTMKSTRARSAKLAAHAQPCVAANCLLRAESWSYTMSSCPAFRMFADMGVPMLPMPMNPTRMLASPASLLELHAHLPENFARRRECLDPRGHTGIDRRVQENLANLLRRRAVGDRAPHVHLQLVRPDHR